MFKKSIRRRSFQPAIMNLDMRVMPTMDMPVGGWVEVPITQLVSLTPPPVSQQTADTDTDLLSSISLTDGL